MIHPFYKGYYINKSVSELNTNLEKLSYWAYQRKMQFNADPKKQANEVIFSPKPGSITYSIHLSNLIIMTFLNAPHCTKNEVFL